MDSGIRFDIEGGKIKAEIDVDFLAYLFDTHKDNFDGEKPAALVRKEKKTDFAKAVVERLQEQSEGERDCVLWAEPLEDIFNEFLEDCLPFLKYGEVDGFEDEEIKRWEKLLDGGADNG